MALLPGSELLITTSYDHTLRIWNRFTGVEMRQLTFTNPITDACLIAQDLIAVADGDVVKIINFETLRDLEL